MRAIRLYLDRRPDVAPTARLLDQGCVGAEGREDCFGVAARVRVGVVFAHVEWEVAFRGRWLVEAVA